MLRPFDHSPVQQSRAWARALETLSPRVLSIRTADASSFEGVLHERPDEPGTLLCLHGPILDWSKPAQEVAKQLALFIQESIVCWKETYREIPRQLYFQPRILKQEWKRLLHEGFSIPFTGYEESSTLQKELESLPDHFFERVHPRLRRTLRKTLGLDLQLVFEPFVPSAAFQIYHQSLTLTGRRKGFIVPPWSWFKALGRSDIPCLFLAQARYQSSSSRAWILIDQGVAHFLFGESTGPKLPGQVALGAAVQWIALTQASNWGARRYDFHGLTLLDTAASANSSQSLSNYETVSRFKKQFQGEVLSFVHPAFEIDI